MSPRTASLGSKEAADRLLALLVFVLIPLCGLLLTNKADPDLWMHLRTGRLIVDTRDVPRADLFSFSSAGREWISHEWLFQLLAWLIFSAAGPAGLMIAKGLVGAGTLRCLYLLVCRQAEILSVRLLVFLLGAAVILPLGLTCRPQIVTYFLLAFVLLLFERAADGPARRRLFEASPWLLVPWSWFHGGFVAGAAVYALIAAAEAFRGRRVARLAINLALALAATAINPYGLRLWGRLADTLGAQQLGRLTLEWQPFWRSDEPFYRGAIVLLAAIGATAFALDRERRRRIAQWLLAGAGLAASLVSVRHLVLLTVLVAGPAAAGLGAWRERRGGTGRRPAAAFFAVFNGALLLVAAFLLWWTLYFTPVVRKVPIGSLVYGEEEASWVVYPKGAVEFMRESGTSGRVWSDANVGGYLVWHLYPGSRVFMDTRFEHVYTAEQMTEYEAVMSAAPGWSDILARWGADLLLLPAACPLARAAVGSGWRELYRDPDYLLLSPGARAPSAPAVAGRPPRPWLFP